MDPIHCTHNNFNFKRTINPVKRTTKMKLKPKRKAVAVAAAAAAAAAAEQDEEDIKDIDADSLPNIFENYAIYIHNSATRNRLKAIAQGLGAVVSPDITVSTTHVVIEPKGDPKLLKLIKQALSKGITCASPQWLLECYEKKKYYSATYYPYDMDKDAHILNLDSTEITAVSNPFGTTYIDYDAAEITRANGGQTSLDRFITKRAADTPEPASQNQEYASFDDQQSSTAPYLPDMLDENEEMAREFYYNSNEEASACTFPNSVSLVETEQEVQEKRKQADERALKAKQVIQQRMARLEKEPLRSKKTIQSGFGERLRIWYGEQTVRQEDCRKRRVVQSVLGNQLQSSTTSPSSRRQSAKKP